MHKSTDELTMKRSRPSRKTDKGHKHRGNRMTFKLMKRCSVSIKIRKMQIKESYIQLSFLTYQFGKGKKKNLSVWQPYCDCQGCEEAAFSSIAGET